TVALAASDSADAEQAAVITGELRAAVRRDEHELALGSALRAADAAATKLMLDIARRKTAQPPDSGTEPAGDGTATSRAHGSSAPGPHPTGPTQKRASGSAVSAIVDELLADVDGHPDATFEITWRIVEP